MTTQTQQPGRGRPRLRDDDRMVRRSIRLTPALWKKVDDAGGAAALRKLIAQWQLPKAR